ncbi:MAG: LTA synthase family protein [Planctomycetota bacterium]|jgi:phosphoglycerol transferase MdoB-like AlkP superfamily enzyme
MSIEQTQSGSEVKRLWFVGRVYDLLAPRAYSVIIFCALFCTLAVKFFHSYRMDLVGEYFGWVVEDIAVLLLIEVVLTLICFRRPRLWVIRSVTVFAAVVCTWSVMSAGWVIRTGTQILPTVLLPLIRDPLNSFGIIGVNLAKMPVAAVALLGPSAIALTFFFFVLAKPRIVTYERKALVRRVVISFIIILTAVIARSVVGKRGSGQIVTAGLRYNCQLRAVTYLLLTGFNHRFKINSANIKREIPSFDEIEISVPPKPQRINRNVVIVVLEGIQYRYTSLAEDRSGLTPYLESLAEEGVEFSNTRSSVTHTTKALFGLLTGRYPSVSQDIAEAVPITKPYASLATIVKGHLNFRTAFFQSAKGNFECRPGLVNNLGFDKFWARDDLSDPNCFVGFLGCDEFSMLKPIVEWIEAGSKPFLVTILCSVTHDPYEVPEWFAEPAKEPVERYRQSISYTDQFLAALDVELAKLGLLEETIFCIVGDHGEAFGEHGLLGHERIAFDENLRIPWVIRAPFLIDGASKVTEAFSSVDLTPTLLGLLGFDISGCRFDGVNALEPVAEKRKVYFSGWMWQGPAGFISDNRKFIYDTTTEMVSVYDLSEDALELVRCELEDDEAGKVADEVSKWRKNSIFRINQKKSGTETVFDFWLCRWTDRVSSARYCGEKEN